MGTASASRAPSLSTAWKVIRSQKDTYTGGKISLSLDEKWLACWCGEAVKLLEIETGNVIREFSDAEDGFLCFSLSPNKAEMVTAQRSGLVRIWNTESGECAAEWRAHDMPITCIAFDRSGKFVATGATDRSVRVWDARKGFCTHNFSGHGDIITCVLFGPTIADEYILFSASRDGGIRRYNLHTKQEQVLSNHMSAVTSLAACDETGQLVSVGRDKVFNVWKMDTATLVKTVPVMEELESVCVLPKGTRSNETSCFVTVGERGRARIWRFSDLRLEAEQKPDEEAASAPGLVDVISRPAFEDLLLVTSDHNLVFYSLDSFQQRKLITGFNDEILDIRCLPQSDSAVVATNSEQVRVVNLDTFDTHLLRGHSDIVLGVSVSSCGKFVATASKDNTVRVFQLNADGSGRCVAVGEGHTASVAAVAFAPRSTSFLVSGGDDRTLKAWPVDGDGRLGRTTSTVMAHDKDINAIAVAPNDKLVASASHDKTVKLWRVQQTGDDNAAPTLAPHATLKGHRRGVWSVCFSPVEKALASSSGDRTVRLWSLVDFSCTRVLQGHTASVLRVCFMRSGLQLLSAGADALLKLWTLRTSECVATYSEPHSDRIWALDVRDDGVSMLSGGADSMLALWSDATAEKAEEAQKQRHAQVQLEQRLHNAEREGDLGEAVQLALQAGRPRHLHQVLSSADPDAIPELVAGIDAEHWPALLRAVVEWNTTARRSELGQRVLRAMLGPTDDGALGFDREQLMQVDKLAEALEALEAYSQRHFQRIDRLLRKTRLFDYALELMGEMEPLPGEDEALLLPDGSDFEQPENCALQNDGPKHAQSEPVVVLRDAPKVEVMDPSIPEKMQSISAVEDIKCGGQKQARKVEKKRKKKSDAQKSKKKAIKDTTRKKRRSGATLEVAA